jgi:hypothetical protein
MTQPLVTFVSETDAVRAPSPRAFPVGCALPDLSDAVWVSSAKARVPGHRNRVLILQQTLGEARKGYGISGSEIAPLSELYGNRYHARSERSSVNA